MTQQQIDRIRKAADELAAIRKECERKDAVARNILGDMSNRLHTLARGYERMLR